MDQKIVSVQPIALAIVDGFKIMGVSMLLNENSAVIDVNLMNGDQIISSKSLVLDGQDYINWGANFPFLNGWIASKLGMTLVN